MRIVIDIQSVIGKKTGVGKYTEGLVKALARLSSSHEFILFYFNFRSRFNGLEVNASNFVNKGVRLPGRIFNFFWKKGSSFSFERLSGKADLFHFPNFILRPVKSGKTIATIHDLAFRRFPQYIEKKNLDFLNNNIPRTLAKVNKIIAVSEFTKKELLSFYPLPEEKIRVIHEGVDENFRKIEEKGDFERIKRKYNLPEKFFLWVGTIEPRKNISGLLQAWAIFKERRQSDCKLVIVGQWGWNYQDFRKELEKLKTSGEIIFTQYVADREMPSIYSLAQVFLFPSIYEGFGLPPLEAMACGVPVITTPALSEVVEEAALKVSPENVEEMALAMAKVLENKDLREELIQKGFKQVEKFSWEKAAQQTLNLYEEVLGEK